MGIQVPESQIAARPGRLLISRHDPGQVLAAGSRTLVLPDTYREKRISCSATIERVGPNCPPWATPGTQIILASARGKSLSIGARDETVWESIPPSFVLATIRATTTPVTRRTPEHPFRDIDPEDRVLVSEEDDLRDEEGR